MAGNLNLKIVVDANGVQDGLAIATKSVADFADKVRADLAGAGRAASEATEPIEGFLGHVRELRSEGRIGSFLSREIQGVGLAGRGAAGELGGLVAALAMGSGLGVGIEAVKLVAGAFKEWGAEEAKTAAEHQKFMADMAAGTQRVADQVRAAVLSMSGASRAEILAINEINPLYIKQAAAIKAVAAAQGELEAARLVYDTDAAGMVAADTTAEQAKLTAARADLAAIEKDIAEREKSASQLQGADVGKNIQRDANDQIKAAQDVAAARLKADTEAAQADEKFLAEEVKNRQASNVAMDKAEASSAEAIQKYGELRVESQDKISKQLQLARDKENKEWTDGVTKAVHVVGSAFDQNFKAVLAGTESVTEGFVKMGEATVSALVDGLVKIGEEELISALTSKTIDSAKAIAEVTHSAGVAGAAAAASTAAIPGIGPILAIEAGGSMAAAVLAAFTPMASAAGGFDIPGGVNPVTQLHAREMVLPAELADGMRSMVASGGGDGAVHFHLHTVYADAAGLRKMMQHPDVLRGVREARRNGLGG